MQLDQWVYSQLEAYHQEAPFFNNKGPAEEAAKNMTALAARIDLTVEWRVVPYEDRFVIKPNLP